MWSGEWCFSVKCDIQDFGVQQAVYLVELLSLLGSGLRLLPVQMGESLVTTVYDAAVTTKNHSASIWGQNRMSRVLEVSLKRTFT